MDPDILWHILMGRDICLSGRISMDNPYTWIPGTHWNQHEWLYDIMIYLVSELAPDFVRGLFMTPFATVQEAYDAASAKLGRDASVLLMPFGGSTLPKLAE